MSALAATSTLGLALAVLFAVFAVVLVIVGAVRGVLAPVSLWPSPAGGTQQVAAVFGVLPVILLAMVIHYQVHPLVRAQKRWSCTKCANGGPTGKLKFKHTWHRCLHIIHSAHKLRGSITRRA
jgi:hypothetical protein